MAQPITIHLERRVVAVPCYLRPELEGLQGQWVLGAQKEGIILSQDVSLESLEIGISKADLDLRYDFWVEVNGIPRGGLLLGDATLNPGDTQFFQSLTGVARAGDVIAVRMRSPGSSHIAPFEVGGTLTMLPAELPALVFEVGPVWGWDEDPFDMGRAGLWP